jgi:hypothetical protein
LLVRITGSNYCAGLVLENDIVIEAAPILAFTVGWHRQRLVNYFRQRRFLIEPVA